MKHKKKRDIGRAVLTCLPMVLLLACGAAGEKASLEDLMKQASIVQTDSASGQSGYLPETLTDTEDGVSPALSKKETAFVHICGEVKNPGVYEVLADARVCDVLLLAGGFTENAARDAVNMAGKVSDGMQVVIPNKEEAKEAAEQEKEEESGRINLNTASAEQLCTLPGIGESRAKAIIAYREEHGGFKTAEEIMQVSGIKEGMYEKLKEFVYVK